MPVVLSDAVLLAVAVPVPAAETICDGMVASTPMAVSFKP
jgi:hypothetical protein